ERMRRLIFSEICSSGNSANRLKPISFGITSSLRIVLTSRGRANAQLLSSQRGVPSSLRLTAQPINVLRYMITRFSFGPIAPARIECWLAQSVRPCLNVLEWRFVVTIESLVRRLSVPVAVFFLTLAPMLATVHAAENPHKITVVSFGLFGDQGVFRRE